MDGMLSQDEINALLAGMDTSGGGDAAAGDSADAPAPDAGAAPSAGGSGIDESLLTDTEKDAIGEVANISMGSSATTLYIVLRRHQGIPHAEARRTSCHHRCIAAVDIEVQPLGQLFLEILVDAVLCIHEILQIHT